MIIGYHGTAGTAVTHVGFCLADDEEAAAGYAAHRNAGATVSEVHVHTAGLTVIEVDYDYDGCEPIIPDGCTADIVTYIDSDMQGRDHGTWMLLTQAAVDATRIVGARELTN